MAIRIVGLGPGSVSLLTRDAWEVLSRASEVYLRTSRHPAVPDLPPGLTIHSFDFLYEREDDFSAVYRGIIDRVLELGRRPGGVIYCVPGHPLVGESTVTGLLATAPSVGLKVEVIAGLSFIEPTLTALNVDAMGGLQIADALDIALCMHPPLNPDTPAILGQLYDRALAGEVKLTLMNQYPDDHQVTLVHGAGTEGEKIEVLPLYELDHSRHVAHMTSLYVPALPQTSAFESFQGTIARLRAPDGCPWDREQTHQSLRAGLMEETAEVLDALDAEDMDALCEELGDLLLHIVMQTQIAAEDGDFTAAEVIAGIDAKIRRRHPHVFADTRVSSAEEVLVHWDLIKEAERGTGKSTSVMDKVPAALPALARASALIGKAARAGTDQSSLDHVVALVRREIDGVLAATDPTEQATRMGDLLLLVANWARWLEVDPESELRAASQRFARRFRTLEEKAARRDLSVDQLSLPERQTLWHASQPGPD